MRAVLGPELGLATMLAVSALPALAGPLDPLIGAPGDCYYRFYDAAHLANHPRQRVESFALKYDDSYQDPNVELTLAFRFILRNGAAYEGTGLCKGNRCGVEGDGGRFALAPHRDGLRLDVDGRAGMGVEGERDFSGNLFDSDDRSFLLYPARPAVCDW